MTQSRILDHRLDIVKRINYMTPCHLSFSLSGVQGMSNGVGEMGGPLLVENIYIPRETPPPSDSP